MGNITHSIKINSIPTSKRERILERIIEVGLYEHYLPLSDELKDNGYDYGDIVTSYSRRGYGIEFETKNQPLSEIILDNFAKDFPDFEYEYKGDGFGGGVVYKDYDEYESYSYDSPVYEEVIIEGEVVYHLKEDYPPFEKGWYTDIDLMDYIGRNQNEAYSTLLKRRK